MAEVGWGDRGSLILGTMIGGSAGLGFWELPGPGSWGQVKRLCTGTGVINELG